MEDQMSPFARRCALRMALWFVLPAVVGLALPGMALAAGPVVST
jgi:hypothetical protein